MAAGNNGDKSESRWVADAKEDYIGWMAAGMPEKARESVAAAAKAAKDDSEKAAAVNASHLAAAVAAAEAASATVKKANGVERHCSHLGCKEKDHSKLVEENVYDPVSGKSHVEDVCTAHALPDDDAADPDSPDDAIPEVVVPPEVVPVAKEADYEDS